MSVPILFARKCVDTGRGIDEGYVILDGECITSDYVAVQETCFQAGYNTDEGYDRGIYYYTEWNSDEKSLIEQGFAYDADGNEYEYDGENWVTV